MFPHGFKSQYIYVAFFSNSFFLHLLFLFSSTFFRMHPYFGTVITLAQVGYKGLSNFLPYLVFAEQSSFSATVYENHRKLS